MFYDISSYFRPGKGVLVRHGLYHYPARLLLRLDPNVPKGTPYWRIRWWRHCFFPQSSTPQLPDAIVPEDAIVDELWNDQVTRRSIRVSQ